MKNPTQKLFMLILLLTISLGINAQSDAAGPLGHFRVAGYYVGWNTLGAPGSLDVRNDFAGQPINFFAGGAAPGFQRMTILGTNGFVGIGLGTPTYRLDVRDNINITMVGSPYGQGYRIGGFTVLQNPGLENIFVGRGSAANFTGATMGQNTFVGFNAGGSYTTSGDPAGDRNTFVGRAAGFSMINGKWNTFVGCDAGLLTATGNSNTFVGEYAG